ncbi:MAG: hypothetical protein IJC55_00130 [Clostridia bacterium]|nr:hypothetical protein [Clostridia bacterium]
MNKILEYFAELGLTFEPSRFTGMLRYMGIGMLVIFVIIAVIILVTMIINKAFSDKKESK